MLQNLQGLYQGLLLMKKKSSPMDPVLTYDNPALISTVLIVFTQLEIIE